MSLVNSFKGFSVSRFRLSSSISAPSSKLLNARSLSISTFNKYIQNLDSDCTGIIPSSSLNPVTSSRGQSFLKARFSSRFYSTDSTTENSQGRVEEDIDVMRRRINWESRKRGILEADLILSSFTSDHLSSFNRAQLVQLEDLLEVSNDWDLFYWVTGQKPAPEDITSNPMYNLLVEHVKNKRHLMNRMPNLEDAK
ncbi:Succinate dehydrogenase assembly factor 2-B, mitochondrial [Smittium mucronatum]|uniref:Succinate dehydrogenase assembly factor 2, mitochondrial n=1 Tax=Smittium mucronatum TaxID=133383 RepID=A0A1R0GZD2_9FUNG|nr:Succinate dehydrogenase assembly factor 2-B, mitochondrial [Smittium mucronatum]